MVTKNLIRFATYSAVITIISSCGGGGQGGTTTDENPNPYTPSVTTSISLSNNKGYVGENITVSWSSSNATSCSASNAWTESSDTSGSATISPDAAGLLTFEMTCTGDGGSDSASASLQIFKYDKLSDSAINKNWDAAGLATITQGVFEGNGYLSGFDYSGDADNQLTVTAFEATENSFELGFSGSTADGDSFDYNLVSNDWNSSDDLLFDADDSGTPSYALVTATYDNGASATEGFKTLPAYQSALGIDYVSQATIEIETDLSYFIFAASVGEKTETDDMPTSGSSTKELDSLGYYYQATAAGGNPHPGYVIADGQGSLEFDYTNNTVNGSLTYDMFVLHTDFRGGNSTYDDIMSIADQTLTLQNGNISGNQFSAEIVLASSSSAEETIQVSIEANANGPGNVYVIDGVQKKSLIMSAGTTYTFNYSSAHPLRFSTTNDGTHNGGSDYTTGVTTSNGVTQIEVTSDTPSTLYYYCQAHSGMGADISITNTEAGTSTGTVEGYFYGPNADEVGLSLMLYDNNDNADDFYLMTAGAVGQTE